MNRREMLATMGIMAAGGSLLTAQVPVQKDAKSGLRIFDARDFGATGDGATLDTASINRAIDACHAAGGGVVYLAPGTYLSGTVVLKSNVTLYLEAGATLLGSKNLSDYGAQSGPPQKGDVNQKHLVFARDAENVGLAGPGRIDGQGPSFWVPSGRVQPPPEDDWRDVIAYDGRRCRVHRQCWNFTIAKIFTSRTCGLRTRPAGRCGRFAANTCSSAASASRTRSMGRTRTALRQWPFAPARKFSANQ